MVLAYVLSELLDLPKEPYFFFTASSAGPATLEVPRYERGEGANARDRGGVPPATSTGVQKTELLGCAQGPSMQIPLLAARHGYPCGSGAA